MLEAFPAMLAAKEVGVGPVKPSVVWFVPGTASKAIVEGSIPPCEAILFIASDTVVPGVKMTVR